MVRFNSAEAFRDHVETNKAEFIQDAFLGFPTAQNVSHDPDNKGSIVKQRISYEKNIVKDWKILTEGDFSQQMDISPLEIFSYLCQIRDYYVPTEVEKSYLGMFRKKGQVLPGSREHHL